MPDQPETNDPDAIQHRIRQLRAGLLSGRGPGATPDEITQWQRDRPLLGAHPAPAERQEVADQAILARSVPDELEHLIVRQRAGLAALAEQLRDRRGRAGATYEVNNAHVVCGNVQTANATVYIIDTVLMPPAK